MELSPRTIREQVTNQIRNDLVSGRFEAGTMLREAELVNRFGVSRGPVRDAFIQLSHEGFLAYYPNRGVMVRQPPNPDDRPFIMSLRVQIETHAIERGCETVSDAGLQKVEAALAELKTACESQSAPAIALHDVEFHESIVIACGCEDLVPAWRQLCSRMLMAYSRLNNYDEAYSEHVEIFECLRSRNTKATIKAVKSNII
tara:strand:- start:354 stop:956 length:603 start_codon:yes stop_codon:yes gene_type:complete